MKKITYILLGLVSLATVVTSCKDPNEGSTFAIFENLPIGLTLESDVYLPQYSLWVEMLKKADVYNALNLSAVKYTCFVASNDAVNEFLAKKGYSSIDDMDPEYLLHLMRYHVVVNVAIPRAAITVGRLSDTTATGDYLMSRFIDGNNIFINENSKIINFSKDGNTEPVVINGNIHRLDKMLDPVTTTLWEQIQEDPRYSIFAQATELTGFNELLNERYYYVEDETSGIITRLRRRATLFIVPDAVFAENGINNIQDLVDRFGYGDTNYTDPSNQVYQYVGYHIIRGYNAFDDLTTFHTTDKRKNVSSFASNELIQLEEDRGTLYFNRSDNGGCKLGSVQDIPAINGVWHDITGLLPVYTPSATVALFELTDFLLWPEWSGVAGYRGASGATVTTSIGQNEFTFLRWRTPEESAGSITYNWRSGWSLFTNHDVLIANMGGVGWWEIDLPAIVKGRYSFQFNYHFAVGERGTYQPMIDGRAIGAPVNFRGTSYVEVWSTAITLFFVESGAHTLRFSQVTAGQMEIDNVRFTPIN